MVGERQKTTFFPFPIPLINKNKTNFFSLQAVFPKSPKSIAALLQHYLPTRLDLQLKSVNFTAGS